MRIFSLIPVLAALATAVAGVSFPRDGDCSSEMGCDVHLPTKRDPSVQRVPPISQGPNTSLCPSPVRKTAVRRSSHARRVSFSPTLLPNIAYCGIIRARNTADNSVLGYVAASFLGNGQIPYTTDDSNALVVSFETDFTGSGSQLNLAVKNQIAHSHGYLGLAQGIDDTTTNLAHGSYQYTALTTSTNTGPGALPVPSNNANTYTDLSGFSRPGESAVWSYDSTTGVLSPHWVNGDGSVPTVQSFVSGTGFFVGGDETAFNAKYLNSASLISFEFVGL